MGKKTQFPQIYKRDSCYKGEVSINSSAIRIMQLLLDLIEYEISSLPKKKKKKRNTNSILYNFYFILFYLHSLHIGK